MDVRKLLDKVEALFSGIDSTLVRQINQVRAAVATYSSTPCTIKTLKKLKATDSIPNEFLSDFDNQLMTHPVRLDTKDGKYIIDFMVLCDLWENAPFAHPVTMSQITSIEYDFALKGKIDAFLLERERLADQPRAVILSPGFSDLLHRDQVSPYSSAVLKRRSTLFPPAECSIESIFCASKASADTTFPDIGIKNVDIEKAETAAPEPPVQRPK